MGDITEKLLIASYKGAEFFFQDLSTSSGRKIVSAEIVNSDDRIIEDLGLLNDTFTIVGITSGDDFSTRDRLIRALKSAGSGQLSHPTLGLLTVTSTTYTTVETLDNLGVTTFDMEFIVAKDVIILPRRAGVSPAEINNKSEALLDKVLDFFSNQFSISSIFPNNFVDAVDKSKDLTESFVDTALRFRSVSSGSSNELFRLLGDADINRTLFVADSQAYGALIGDLFRAIDGTGDSGKERSDIARSFSDFGDTDPVISTTTQQLAERDRNRMLVNDTMKASSLAQVYRAAPLIDFLTVNDIEEERRELDLQYFDVINSDVLSDEIRNDINDLRNTVRVFLDNEAESAFNLTPFKTFTNNALVIVFNQYGDLELFDEIINVNDIKDISFIEGEINVLSKESAI